MSHRWRASAPWSFRDKEYEVSLGLREEKLLVEVEDAVTADQWRGSFDSRHIEELTRKTGNFKQFSVFVNMLESAIVKSTESVTLQLLTYVDLENLRHQTTHSLSNKLHSPINAHSKRYLILTYSAEFDRIHYPLALPYVGKPDPAVLQETIKQLQKELEKCNKKCLGGQRSSSSLSRLQKKYDSLLVEKEELENAYEELQQEIEEGRVGDGDKQIRALKRVINNLEDDLLKEKTKYQRILSKKNEEIRRLSEELKELRSSERMLNTRVKSLTNELAMMRRHSPALIRNHSNRNHVRSGSSQNITQQKSTRAHFRQRSSSVEDCVTTGNRIRSTGAVRNRLRTPSPRGNFQRFNPTAYVENKRRMQDGVNIRLRRTRSRSSSAGSVSHLPPRVPLSTITSRKINLGTRSRSSSVGSQGSRASSIRSSFDSCNGGEHVSYKKRTSRSTGKSKSSTAPRKSRLKEKDSPVHFSHVSSSTPKSGKRNGRKHNESSQMNHSIEIQEIDARLNALQQYMKKSLDRHNGSR